MKLGDNSSYALPNLHPFLEALALAERASATGDLTFGKVPESRVASPAGGAPPNTHGNAAHSRSQAADRQAK
jgi:hypothetical protein